jgi:hypothetical protein
MSRSFQVVVELLEVLTGVVDGLELHGFEERGAVDCLVVSPPLDSEEECVETVGWGILEVLELSVRIRLNP